MSADGRHCYECLSNQIVFSKIIFKTKSPAPSVSTGEINFSVKDSALL